MVVSDCCKNRPEEAGRYDVEADLSRNLYKLWKRMASGSYVPPPVKQVEIAKKSGDGKRIAQNAILVAQSSGSDLGLLRKEVPLNARAVHSA
jgi:hypothetical protein